MQQGTIEELISECQYNTQDIFEITGKNSLENKSILLVDDVVTTGSTLIAAAKELAKINGIKISVLTLGVAKD